MTISLPCLVDQIPGEASFVFIFHLTNFLFVFHSTNFHSFLGQFPPSASLTKYHFQSARFSNPDIFKMGLLCPTYQLLSQFWTTFTLRPNNLSRLSEILSLYVFVNMIKLYSSYCFAYSFLFLCWIFFLFSAGVQIMWQKLDSKKTIIAVGEMVIDPQVGKYFHLNIRHQNIH